MNGHRYVTSRSIMQLIMNENTVTTQGEDECNDYRTMNTMADEMALMIRLHK
jgi:hypothetical protein